MGGTRYDFGAREDRAKKVGYASKSASEIFTQNALRKAHESMNPNGVIFREARDSEVHPNTVPIILGLDVTGSMGHIPHELIKEGLPKLMGGIIQGGVPDPALLFLGIGDHECDRYPLQVGQFESGDEELDMWLTRTYIEGGGGGNAGESYLLAWYFAAFHTKTDAFEKRGQKGLLFTVGDEPGLKTLPASAIKEIMGQGQQTYTHLELLAEAQKRYDVYHISVLHSGQAINADVEWKELLGQNCLSIEDHREIPNVIKKIICDKHKSSGSGLGTIPVSDTNDKGLDNIQML
ncbi:hypothetical protein [Flavobacterium johnsoniae]|jgi:hypothetical protein|uniref:Uncharacterized protein n=1 Tax=Flavobacterium johnsoniae (strain ATCC 17061 / DSM 2064 / JCM 8514 / BCRC 14874 / CCUG 350202 / NBRC 14942 / NCIMB 11054 / UW101) TaxID=376686 RepID=A5FLY0_FLAJ1|nr:hypothetical protein [Flavobacterium johnsoniae]ABQ03787.1 hypothetical protein Fjoh_0752 [Flavobacterium johnsoniae UW101]OXG03309.1 hypothetical protein B0A63_00620 [Flavobacterium johnsoniae UW101]WQG79349.1 hypothetical protein SR927_15100 [Flavobacterium johnsoniae UW101]SHK02706.1 hypothetical protein SAMN05444146_0154 [Flavobacterium johnsoniae]